MNNVNFRPEQTAVQIQVMRNTSGLSIYARTTPKLEEFFKVSSGGSTEIADFRLNGRYWALKDGVPEFKIYSMAPEKALQGVIISKRPNAYGYILDAPGRKIIEPENNGRGNIVNISFLRAVGISEDGIEFSVRGVFSEDQVRQIYEGILDAVGSFYEAFMRPINLTINLQEN